MKAVTIKDVLRDGIAVAFPPIGELTRKIAFSYQLAYSRVADDPHVSQRDRKIGVGNTRRLYVNFDLIEYAEQYPDKIEVSEKMEGDEGYNNRVELKVGSFLVTAHHHTRSSQMPEDFINLSAAYNRSNSLLNDDLQAELFPLEDIVAPDYRSDLLNLLILHETSQESMSQVAKIEFVFPKKSQKLIRLDAAELVDRQSQIDSMDADDLEDFKRKSKESLRRLIG